MGNKSEQSCSRVKMHCTIIPEWRGVEFVLKRCSWRRREKMDGRKPVTGQVPLQSCMCVCMHVWVLMCGCIKQWRDWIFIRVDRGWIKESIYGYRTSDRRLWPFVGYGVEAGQRNQIIFCPHLQGPACMWTSVLFKIWYVVASRPFQYYCCSSSTNIIKGFKDGEWTGWMCGFEGLHGWWPGVGTRHRGTVISRQTSAGERGTLQELIIGSSVFSWWWKQLTWWVCAHSKCVEAKCVFTQELWKGNMKEEWELWVTGAKSLTCFISKRFFDWIIKLCYLLKKVNLLISPRELEDQLPSKCQ